MITAKRAVETLENGRVDLLKTIGHDANGRWQSDLEKYQDLSAVVQNATAKEVSWLENGGERLKQIKRVFFDEEPSQVPDFLLIEGVSHKVIFHDFRPTRDYYKLLAEEVADVKK